MIEWQPSEQVEIIAGTPPGGGQDRAARALAAALEATCDIDVAVSNMPGRGGGTAWEALSKRRGDPHVLSVASPTFVTNHINDPSEVGLDDLTHLALLCTEYLVFVVAADSVLSSGADVVAALRSPTHSVAIALATALGNVNHVAVATVADHAGPDLQPIGVTAFDSARTAVAEVLTGGADLAVVSAASALPEIKAGTARGLAVSAPKRLAGPLSNVPTWTEMGVPLVSGTWRSVVAPPNLPEAAVAYWERALERACSGEPWTSSLSQYIWTNTFLRSEATRRFVYEEELLLRQALSKLDLAG